MIGSIYDLYSFTEIPSICLFIIQSLIIKQFVIKKKMYNYCEQIIEL
jgi:hypothetical protein